MHAISAPSQAGALLSYLSETQKNSLAHITQITPYQGGDTMFLDRMDASQFGTDRKPAQWRTARIASMASGPYRHRHGRKAVTQLGRGAAYHRDRIVARQDSVEALRNDYMTADELSEALASVADLERLMGKISYNSLNARDCLALLQSLKSVTPI